MPEAHRACLNVSKALAALGVRVLTDDAFFSDVSGGIRHRVGADGVAVFLQVKRTFEEERKLLPMKAGDRAAARTKYS